MKRLYQRSELTFAIVCIVVYVVVQSAALSLDELIGVPYLASAVACAIQAGLLWCFVHKNGLSERYGLQAPRVSARQFLYYVPLVILMTRNFWNGVTISLPWAGMVCTMVGMLFVGFVEELIFRGFLFKAMARSNVNPAIIVSSLTFGLGHIVNMFNGNGAGLVENLSQIVGAIAIGFLFVMMFYRGGSLWPCIIAHAVINATSVFSAESQAFSIGGIMASVVMIGIALAYAIVLMHTLPKAEAEDSSHE
ncbi:abortive infection protein [Bifidobacterium tsurumiense]|uniref:Abortive infection protein n=3 Tax=Bifidobacterium tsurumiense TaxID=356829 RepID=A0A087EK24_9BIFI|nr:abortive infection protein [Bifidobacterium tsurumiense]